MRHDSGKCVLIYQNIILNSVQLHKKYLNKIAGANFFKFKYTDQWVLSRDIYILTPRLCFKTRHSIPKINHTINSLPSISHLIQDSMSRLRNQVKTRSCFFLAWKNIMPSQLISWCECLCFSLPVRLLLICRILWDVWAIYSQPTIAFISTLHKIVPRKNNSLAFRVLSVMHSINKASELQCDTLFPKHTFSWVHAFHGCLLWWMTLLLFWHETIWSALHESKY